MKQKNKSSDRYNEGSITQSFHLEKFLIEHNKEQSANKIRKSSLPSMFSLNIPTSILSLLQSNPVDCFLSVVEHTNNKWILSIGDRTQSNMMTIRNSQKEGTSITKDFTLKPNTSKATSSTMDIFEATKSNNKEKRVKNNLDYVGRITEHYNLNPIDKPKYSSTSLERIGKKTRELGLQEKRKRKEIMRIDDEEEDLKLLQKHQNKKKKSSLSVFASAIKETSQKMSTSTTTGTHGKRKPPRLNTLSPKKKKIEANKLEPKPTGNMQLLAMSTKNGNMRSNVVRLHGLPVGSKPEHVRLFFKGLDPQRIFILPQHDRFITKIDENNGRINNVKQRKNDHAIEVEKETLIRVFVKFHSIPIAELALVRSGESIRVIKDQNSDTQRFIDAPIRVTRVPKDHAFYFLNNMVRFVSYLLSLTSNLH